MAKAKYDKHTFPKLAESYARDGLIEKDIAAKLGVSVATFENYKNKHVEFLESLKRGKAPIDFEVENALLKRALGYDYDEITEEFEGDSTEPTKRKVIRKHVAPDTTAQIFWLKNRKASHWRNNPIFEGEETKKLILELSKETIKNINEQLEKDY